MNSTEQKIKLLQKNLKFLRILAGWSADDLARMLDVSRQTIVNLENNHSSGMTTMQYLAIRSLLDAAVKSNEDVILDKAIEILVDTDDETYSEEMREKIRNTVKEKNESVGTRIGSKAAGIAVSAVIGTIFAGAGFLPVLGCMLPFGIDFLKTKK